jgi:hypothetical protein
MNRQKSNTFLVILGSSPKDICNIPGLDRIWGPNKVTTFEFCEELLYGVHGVRPMPEFYHIRRKPGSVVVGVEGFVRY